MAAAQCYETVGAIPLDLSARNGHC
jgi:hypothetical protein